jgi:hypothetical protein
MLSQNKLAHIVAQMETQQRKFEVTFATDRAEAFQTRRKINKVRKISSRKTIIVS